MEKFNDIRPFRNDEVKYAFEQLIKEEEFVSVLKFFYQDKYSYFINKLNDINTIDEFQVVFIKPILQGIIDSSISELNFSGTENIESDKPSLFISNHRDIVLDPSLVDLGLHLNNIPTVEIAIGDNLLVKPWIELFVKLNKSFIVRRSLSNRELLASSLLLSEYIRHSIVERKSHIWIAQREGRAKDGNDKTQESLIRMLGMSGETKNLRQSLLPYNISPVSISYEYDPCDGYKALELHTKFLGKTYIKTPQDDLKNMITGIKGNKGKVNFHYSKPINARLSENNESCSRKQSAIIAEYIDDEIYANYRFFDTNKIAYNLLTKTNTFEVSQNKYLEIEDYFLNQLNSVGLNKDELYFILIQYANPVINHLEYKKKTNK